MPRDDQAQPDPLARRFRGAVEFVEHLLRIPFANSDPSIRHRKYPSAWQIRGNLYLNRSMIGIVHRVGEQDIGDMAKFVAICRDRREICRRDTPPPETF